MGFPVGELCNVFTVGEGKGILNIGDCDVRPRWYSHAPTMVPIGNDRNKNMDSRILLICYSMNGNDADVSEAIRTIQYVII